MLIRGQRIMMIMIGRWNVLMSLVGNCLYGGSWDLEYQWNANLFKIPRLGSFRVVFDVRSSVREILCCSLLIQMKAGSISTSHVGGQWNGQNDI